MPCPYHNGDDTREGTDEKPQQADDEQDSGGLKRRDLMKSALLIGGTSALSTVTGLYGMPNTAAAAAEADRVSIADRRNRQHAWDQWETYLPDRQQTVPPAYHLVLLVDYDHDGEPTPGHRRQVADSLDRLEEAFEWSHEGVLFTIGYSAAYFERYDEPLPEGINPRAGPKPALISAETLIEASGVTLEHEDPVADDYDACLHLASDNVQNLLAAEQALWGDRKEINGVRFDATLEGVFTKPESYPERRVGFAGHDALEAQGGEEKEDGIYPSDIPEEAELSMGFNDQYRNSIPRETDATMLEDQQLVEPKPPGVFAQGTIQHVSKLDINLAEDAGQRDGGWYDDHDLEERRELMFSPEHDEENTGEVAENLGNSNAPGDTPMRDLSQDEPDIAEQTQAHAAEKNKVGHAQKTARARFDLQDRLTEEGIERLSGGEQILPADEVENTPGSDESTEVPYDDTLPGHDGTQEAEQVMLRRDVDTVDEGRPGNHFIAFMRFAPYMVYMRRAMNGVDFNTRQFGLDPNEDGFEHSGEVPDENNGIVNYLTTRRRANFLIPPLTLRALPHPQGDEVSVSVSRDGDRFVVETDELDRGDIDIETVRFGWFYDVNRGRGASPARISNSGGTLTLEFPVEETGVDDAPGGPGGDDDVRLRLFAKRNGTLRPIRATTNLQDVSETKTAQPGRGRGK